MILKTKEQVLLYAANQDLTIDEYATREYPKATGPGGEISAITLSDGTKIGIDISYGDVIEETETLMTEVLNAIAEYLILEYKNIEGIVKEFSMEQEEDIIGDEKFLDYLGESQTLIKNMRIDATSNDVEDHPVLGEVKRELQNLDN
ncbi:hypothetical protein [Flammeovirga agarivorans]|uniref:Uncharacterized protein n=1 Tax=Flammeovirga agarivorans TaxID=2726742 RepID=A0A7X8SRA3_9BACT|nr:hypothetical protein [Flammeovirga agarivorans]NLR94964.1 hypothetical protein [Flammeovirga agarivorans]